LIGSLGAKPQSTKNSIVMQPKVFFSFAKVLRLNRFVDQDVVKVGFFFEASVGAMEVAMWLLVWLVKDEHSVQAEFVRVFEMDAVANLGEVGNPAHAECGGFVKCFLCAQGKAIVLATPISVKFVNRVFQPVFESSILEPLHILFKMRQVVTARRAGSTPVYCPPVLIECNLKRLKPDDVSEMALNLVI